MNAATLTVMRIGIAIVTAFKFSTSQKKLKQVWIPGFQKIEPHLRHLRIHKIFTFHTVIALHSLVKNKKLFFVEMSDSEHELEVVNGRDRVKVDRLVFDRRSQHQKYKDNKDVVDDGQSELSFMSTGTADTAVSKVSKKSSVLTKTMAMPSTTSSSTTLSFAKTATLSNTATTGRKPLLMSEIEQKRKLITIYHINPWTQEYKPIESTLSTSAATVNEEDDEDDTENRNGRVVPQIIEKPKPASGSAVDVNFIVDWNDPVLITDELLERLLDDMLNLYKCNDNEKDIAEIDKKMYSLWNLTPNDLEMLQPSVLDIRIQAEWAKQQGRVLQLLFYCQTRKLAGPSINQSERSLRNTLKFQKIMSIIDLYNTRLRSSLQLLEYSTSGLGQTFKPSTNLVTVCLYDATFKPNPHQIILMHILDKLRDGDYRRYGDCVYKQCYTKNNEPMHYWKEHMTISAFVHHHANSITHFDIWKYLKSATEANSICKRLREDEDPRFPTLQPNRYYMTWRNGVYDIYNGVFYPHKDRLLPSSVASCKKFKFDFPFDEFITMCKTAYDADPANRAAATTASNAESANRKAATAAAAKKDSSTDQIESDSQRSIDKLVSATDEAIKAIQSTLDVGKTAAEKYGLGSAQQVSAQVSKVANVPNESSLLKTDSKNTDDPVRQDGKDNKQNPKVDAKKYASNQRRKKINESFGAHNHKYLKYWHVIPTPLFDSILTYQKLPLDVQHVVYQQIGKLFYWINQVEEWQQMMFIKGLPGTGKSSLLNIVSAFYEKKDLAKISAGIEEKFGLAPLLGRYILMCSEVKKRMGIDQTMFQNMVEGETTTFNHKNKDVKEATWDTPLIFAGNENPDWTEFGGNIGRRMLLVIMEQKVRSQDVDLKYKIVNNELAALQFKCNCAYRMKIVECGSDNIWKHLPKYFTDTRQRVTGEMNPLQMFFTESGKVRLQEDANSSVFLKATDGKDKDASTEEVYFEKNEDGQFIISEDDFLHLYAEFCEINQYKRGRWNADFYQGIFEDVSVRRHKARYMYKGSKRDNTYLIGVAEVQYRSSRIAL